MPRVYWGSVGDGNADIDAGAKTRDGEQNYLMINKVRIGYYEYEGLKDIRWYFCIALFHVLFKMYIKMKNIYIVEAKQTNYFFYQHFLKSPVFNVLGNQQLFGPFCREASTS